MAKFELRLPKMGESVAEATITAWLKEVGDSVELDDTVLEIATDKVDSEVPSEVEGVLIEKRFNVDDVVQVGEVLAIIETVSNKIENPKQTASTLSVDTAVDDSVAHIAAQVTDTIHIVKESVAPIASTGDRFYSPLVKNIAKQEGITQAELDTVTGTGKDGRVTKNDILKYIDTRSSNIAGVNITPTPKATVTTNKQEPLQALNGDDEIIEMTRMGKLTSAHMTSSLQTSAHVQSFIEVDVTAVWNWRNRIKNDFYNQQGEKLTFTPIFLEAIAKALRDYPLMNITLQGDKIIKKKAINIGLAAALPDGNLIVPVIKNADELSLVGLTKQVNDLANRARLNKLKPDDIQGGTYTVTNVGSFGSIMGTPIINQPQVGILAIGAIRKVPAVIETPEGDFIGIRHKMFLSHSYDHRVVNGALGGLFIKSVKDYLEAWNTKREL